MTVAKNEPTCEKRSMKRLANERALGAFLRARACAFGINYAMQFPSINLYFWNASGHLKGQATRPQ